MKKGGTAVLLLVSILLCPGPIAADGGGDAPVSAGPACVPASLPASARSPLPASGTYYDVAVGDIDLDGNPDIVAAGESAIGCWSGDGTGSWTSRAGPAGSKGFYAIALADIDHDGRMDIAAAGEPGVRCWLGDAAWGWTPGTDPPAGGPCYALELADINIDGNADVAAAGEGGIRVGLGDGKGGWTAGPSPVSADSWYGVFVGDLNTDGKPDLAGCGNRSGSATGTVCVFLGDGTGAWPSSVTVSNGSRGRFSAVCSADLDQDGGPDLVAAGKDGILCYYGGGSGSWNFGTTPATALEQNALAVTDLDNDGRPDIAAGNAKGVSVWPGDGGKGWPEAPALPLFNRTVLGLAVADLDHDARPDIVAGTNGTGLGLWLSDVPAVNVTGWSAASTGLVPNGKWGDIDFGDIDNDGDLDLVVTSYQNQNRGLKAYLGDGKGCWTESSSGLPATGSFGGIRLADFDLDGRLDLVATTDAGTAGTVGTRVWRGFGNGTWSLAGTVDTRSGAGLETGDLDNDGRTDLVTGFWGGAFGPMVFLGKGDLTFLADSAPASTINVDDVAAGDANNDGKPDFAASTMDTKGIQFFTGDGTGAAASWRREDAGLPSTAVYLGLAMADVDRDGNADLAAAGYGPGNGLHVYLGDGGAGGTVDWAEASRGLPAAADFGGVELADIDLDGDFDLLAGNVSGGGLDLFRGNGGAGGTVNWTEAGKSPLPSSGNVWGVRFGDVDNDGVPDIAATPDGSGVRVWRTVVSRPTFFDRVVVTPSSGNLEEEKSMGFTAQAYFANGTPADGVRYVWDIEGGTGALDNLTGPAVKLTGIQAGDCVLRVTAMQGLFARGDSANITIAAPPRPADVMVLPAQRVSPTSIWLNGTHLTGYRENATVVIGLEAVGRNLSGNDSLVLSYTLAPGLSAVEGTASPPPDSTAPGANGTTLMVWAVPFIENATTFRLSFDIISDVAGDSVAVNLPALSNVSYSNLSGPQVVRLDELRLQVRSVLKEPPGPPLGPQAQAGDGFVRLSWGPPASDGNSSVTGYRIYRGGSAGNETPLTTVGNITEFNDTNVTNYNNYFYRVSALNAVGEGPLSERVRAVPSTGAGPPGVPRNLTGLAGDGFVLLGWEPPVDDGGSAVLGFRIYRGEAAGAGAFLAEAAGTAFNDSSALNDVAYFYSVSARNAAGEGPRTAEINAAPRAPPVVTVPSAPQNLTAIAGDGVVNLSWAPPQDDGGAPVTNYRVMRGTEPGKGAIFRVLGVVLEFSDRNVTDGAVYYYSVSTVNGKGIGPATPEARAQPWALPSAPLNPTATVDGRGHVRCTWDPPATNGGFNITGYIVFRQDSKGANSTFLVIGRPSAVDFNDTTTQRGRTYSYKVAAVTEKGEGPASLAVQVRIPAESTQYGPDPMLWLLPAVAIVIAVLAVLVARIMKRRGKPPESGPGSRQ
jgi:fibronectin type 3 domain-containing protein